MATKHPEHNALQDVKLAVCGELIRSHSNFKLEKAFSASSERSTGANKNFLISDTVSKQICVYTPTVVPYLTVSERFPSGLPLFQARTTHPNLNSASEIVT